MELKRYFFILNLKNDIKCSIFVLSMTLKGFFILSN
nr:MAG TPA: hypothetical protein [Caudoviricetes sp.]DAS96046.1 MAG TPA: hypothetical protein [Caudoviricetes sp.]DAU16549.1 MAG TPA: hypothetical protein [Caudoviricetes sp.]